MTKAESVKSAVERVEETGGTFLVIRRGSTYRLRPAVYPVPRGWAIAEQIGPGNVQNYRERDGVSA